METNVVNITKELLSFSNDLTDGFSQIGIGIGAIMLLIVVLYYIASILNGGKFQMKMLIPVCIFFFVCNFSWIANPVISFTTTITEALCSQLKGVELDIKEKNGLPAGATIGDQYLMAHLSEEVDEDMAKDTYLVETGQADAIYNQPSNEDGEDDSSLPGLSRSTEKKNEGWVADGFRKGVNSVIASMTEAFTSLKNKEIRLSPVMYFWKMWICVLLGSICKAFGYVYNAFGALMTSLIMAFGPITFAFAIMPGQGGTIKSWFLRLCQFTLYSPLSTLINCFCTFLTSYLFGDTSSGTDFAMCLGMEICCLVALVSIPSIASMIIEGASGAVSLSQGLQSLASGLTTGGTIVGGLYTFFAGKDNKVSNFMAGAKEMGISGLASSFSQGGGMSGGFDRMVNDAISRGSASQGHN